MEDNRVNFGRWSDIFNTTKMKTTHNLDFLAAPFEYDPKMVRFKVGTCHGLYACTSTEYQIIAVMNDEKGNGHLTDVLEWFENSAKRDKKALTVCEIWNEGFYHHLINKRGFSPINPLYVIKRFDVKSRTKRLRQSKSHHES